MAETGLAEKFDAQLFKLKLSEQALKQLLPAWREVVLEHTQNPLPFLRKSLLLYPFELSLAYDGAYSLVMAYAKLKKFDVVSSIAKECPQLGLEILASSTPEPTITLKTG